MRSSDTPKISVGSSVASSVPQASNGVTSAPHRSPTDRSMWPPRVSMNSKSRLNDYKTD